MGSKEDADALEDHQSSSYSVLQHISEEACRVAGEALYSVRGAQAAPGLHRRTQSKVNLNNKRSSTNSIQKFKSSMQRAWKWVASSREEACQSSFNPEALANQKRQWYQLHSKTTDHTKYMEPTSLFEHFIIVGLRPDSNLEAVEEAYASRKKWERETANSKQNQGPCITTLDPQILFKYPPGKKLALRLKDLAAFCFPGGIKARLAERTLSLSDLNELVYGQDHLNTDDSSFIFSLKVADNATVYGVCLHVREIVQRQPAVLGTGSPLSHMSSRGCSRFLVSAPRCYCVLTRVPFFELHYKMLNSIIAQERLNRITQFLTEMSLTDLIPSAKTVFSPDQDYSDLMASAIPVDSAVTLTAAAAGIISDDDMATAPSSIKAEPISPDSIATSEASDFSQVRETDKDCHKNMHYMDDFASETSENYCESVFASPEIGAFPCSKTRTLERLESSDSLFSFRSPARSLMSEDEDDYLFANHEKDFGDDFMMEWARENKNDLLQIICAYHTVSVPQRGEEIVFQPLEHLHAIEYKRPPVSAFAFYKKYINSCEPAEVNAKLATAEEARALSIWTIATVCRVLSLESFLTLISGVLLEKQIVIFCPNLGLLCAVVLSLIPVIQPFQWQSLLLPVLPSTMFDFLDAPVPFILGVEEKPPDLKSKTSNLILVDVYNDEVKTCQLATLPRHKELLSELVPVHGRMTLENSSAKKHPVYKCSEAQAEAANHFLVVMTRYMESLCDDLRSHTITSVQSNNDRVSLLLKDTFIDSFPSKDQAFMKLFVDTQIFSVLSDSCLSCFEHEHT